jgi:hypothetical protein
VDADKLNSMRWRAALAVLISSILCAHAAAANDRESPPDLVLRSLAHLRHGEVNAVIPLFAAESLQETSLEQVVGTVQLLGLSDQIESQLVTVESGQSAEGNLVHTVVYHVKGPERALLAVGQVQATSAGPKLIGLRVSPAPLQLSELFPFVLTDLSYVHYYVLIALLFVPALMLYATVRCLRRESGVGWAWIPIILVGIGRASATWIPCAENAASCPADERLFSFVPMAITILGVDIQKVAVFEPWQVSVSAPIGAIIYLWWSGQRLARRLESGSQAGRASSTLGS